MRGAKRVNPGEARPGLNAPRPGRRRLVVFCSTAAPVVCRPLSGSCVVIEGPSGTRTRLHVAGRGVSPRPLHLGLSELDEPAPDSSRTWRAPVRLANERGPPRFRQGFRDPIANDVLNGVAICVHAAPPYLLICYIMQH